MVWVARWVVARRPAASTPLDAALLLLALMVPVAVWASALPELTLPKLTGLILGFAAFRATVNWADTSRRLGWAVGAFLLLGVGLAAVGAVTTGWTNKVPMLSPLLARVPRLVEGLPGAEAGVNANELGGTIILFFPVALAACVSPVRGLSWRGWAARLAAALLALLFAAVVVLTQSRSAWVGAAVGVMAMVWLRWPRARGLLVAGVLVGLLGLLYVGPQAIAEAVLPTASEIDVGTMTSSISLEGRVEIWSRALYAIQDFPFTGCGLGAFRRVVHILYPLFVVGPDSDVAHAHNVFLQVALDLGLPGLVAYLALVGTAAWACWRAARLPGTPNAWLAAGLVGSLAAFHTYGLTDTIALGAKPGFAFWLVLGLAAAVWQVVRTEERAESH